MNHRHLLILTSPPVARKAFLSYGARMGRHASPTALKRSRILTVRTLEAHYAAYEKAARRDGAASISEWIRQLADAASGVVQKRARGT
jgi:hypothetical protein